MYSFGGRGGEVFVVDNLNDSGPGSFRDAVEAEGPRTVVFRVGGMIRLDSRIKVENGNLTVAGQTAPGKGIAIRDATFSVNGVEDVVIGMSHRGRLNVMVNIMEMNVRQIFAGFEDDDPETYVGRGDVKYHLGAKGEFRWKGETADLGIIDFERGVKLSGTRFYVLFGAGARLQRALITWMLDMHINQHGYTEIYPPYMVRREMMVGAAQLPKFADNIYHDAEDDYWWVGTAEIPLTNLHRDEILAPDALPLNYVAYSACFRREKMSAGRDVRGIKRGHQFDKVEMYIYCKPEESNDWLERMREHAEQTCVELGIPHRIKQQCTGDLGFGSTITYDVEAWAPGCNEWLEGSSVSNVTDFKARRANIRYRPEEGGKVKFPHTLNGSGLALARVVAAILEVYQQADGSVVVPDALRDRLGERISPA